MKEYKYQVSIRVADKVRCIHQDIRYDTWTYILRETHNKLNVYYQIRSYAR